MDNVTRLDDYRQSKHDAAEAARWASLIRDDVLSVGIIICCLTLSPALRKLLVAHINRAPFVDDLVAAYRVELVRLLEHGR